MAHVVSGIDGRVIFSVTGPGRDGFVGRSFGTSVAMAGDLNGDGVGDFLVGDPLIRMVYVYSGADASLLYTLEHSMAPGGDNAHYFGESAAVGGDVTGDGVPDLLVGAPKASTGTFLSSDGRVYLYSGSDGTLLHQIDGESAEGAGSALAFLPDMTGDGLAEYIIGSSGWDRSADNSDFGVGRVKVYSGSDNSEIYQAEGELRSDFFGFAIEVLADVNDDGAADYLVTAAGLISSPKLYVYSGADGTLIYDTARIFALQYGRNVGSIGDVNGDGAGDFVVGSTRSLGTGFFQVGQYTVESGVDPAVPFLYSETGRYENDLLGSAFTSLEDLDGDGVREVVVGAPGAELGYNGGHGYVVVLSGADGAFLYQTTAITGGRFGSALD
jgi:hypothetical protein